MKTYDKFLDYYDKIVRSINNPIEDEVDFLVNDCIQEYKPETKSILEFACGTWLVAKALENNWYKVIWVDISEKMLKKAGENISEKKLILWDMRSIKLDKTFDTVLCNYNSICHLLTWEDWQAFFDNVVKHLSSGWLFVFDINTVFEFENITRDFAQFYNFWDDTVCLEMFKKQWIFEWLIKMFVKSENWKYDLIEETIKEKSFAISKIEKELKDKWFELLEKIDYHYGQVTAESERVYFICKKK